MIRFYIANIKRNSLTFLWKSFLTEVLDYDTDINPYIVYKKTGDCFYRLPVLFTRYGVVLNLPFKRFNNELRLDKVELRNELTSKRFSLHWFESFLDMLKESDTIKLELTHTNITSVYIDSNVLSCLVNNNIQKFTSLSKDAILVKRKTLGKYFENIFEFQGQIFKYNNKEYKLQLASQLSFCGVYDVLELSIKDDNLDWKIIKFLVIVH